MLAALFDNLDWQPAVGDPTAMGWFIVGCYAVAEWLCVLNYRRRKQLVDPPRQRRLAVYWLALSLGMLFMGFNKQLDLQVLLHEIGRELARDGGVLGGSRGVKLAFLSGLMFGALIVLAWFITLMKSLGALVLLSSVGFSVLIAYVLARAVSLYVEAMPLGEAVAPGIRVNHLFELAGIALIIGGAWLNLKLVKSRRLTRQSARDLTD